MLLTRLALFFLPLSVALAHSSPSRLHKRDNTLHISLQGLKATIDATRNPLVQASGAVKSVEDAETTVVPIVEQLVSDVQAAVSSLLTATYTVNLTSDSYTIAQDLALIIDSTLTVVVTPTNQLLANFPDLATDFLPLVGTLNVVVALLLTFVETQVPGVLPLVAPNLDNEGGILGTAGTSSLDDLVGSSVASGTSLFDPITAILNA